MNNPVREARVTLGLTQETLAEHAGVHIQAVFLTEQGVYTHILPALVTYLRNVGHLDARELNHAYEEYQKEKRQRYGEEVAFPLMTELGPPDLSRHPFVAFLERVGLSRSKFAKNFCVHPASLYKLERGEARHIPEQLWAALIQGGLDAHVIWELDSRCEEYADGAWTAKPIQSK